MLTSTRGIVAEVGAVIACLTGIGARSGSQPAAPRFPPPQLEMRVPFEPTAFPGAGRTHLIYELYLRNFEAGPIAIRRVEVLDAETGAARPVAAFEGARLDDVLQDVGVRRSLNAAEKTRQLAGGGSAILFMSMAFDGGVPVPSRLRHRVLTADAVVEGATIGTHHTPLRVLGRPLTESGWVARSGPSNDSYHRRGFLVFDGAATIDRRYAIDWVRTKNDATFTGDALDNRSYYAHGESVLAVADGRIVAARGDIPENVPRHDGFRPAVPLSMNTLAGNTITLSIGGGLVAYYMHLQPGSLRVKSGDRVRRGQVLALVGNSGDSREPHLHFELTTSAVPFSGEGVPFLIDRFRVRSADGSWQTRIRELPLADMEIDFGLRAR